VERDLRYYVNYLRRTEGFSGEPQNVEMERFLSFLDVEHYLRLKGSDTWSSEGNESQLMIRQAIGYVLWDHTPPRIPQMYQRFVSRLSTSDWIMTFNYDTLLEQALEQMGKPYRLFPMRFSEAHTTFSTVDNSQDELVVLKMHGSIDWISRATYDDHVKYAASCPVSYTVKHPVFGPEARIAATPIVNGPRIPDDPLLQLYRVQDLSTFLSVPFWECTPFLISPSHTKLLYSSPLVDFWRGLANSGGLNVGFGIIGYSLPSYDDYACQAIYSVARNYQGYEPDFELDGRAKRPARVLDFRPTDEAKEALRSRYCFLEESRTQYWFDGMSERSIDWFLA
jgi:hypothetical protein